MECKLPLFMLTALCASVLTACGGSRADGTGFSFLPIKPPKANHSVPTVKKLLTDTANEGQQLSPSVVSLDHNRNEKVDAYDSVNFRQAALISEICTFNGQKCGGDYENRIKGIVKELDAQIESLGGSSQSGGGKAGGGEAGGKQAAPAPSVNPRVAELQRAKAALEARLESIKDAIVIRDVNNQTFTVNFAETIDDTLFASSDASLRNIARMDAGTYPITDRRYRNAAGATQTVPYAGSVDREFNGLALFRSTSSDSVRPDMYLRHPGAVGWSYQTFGLFAMRPEGNGSQADNPRGIHVGYQSIGQSTRVVPNVGSATYYGIAHAHLAGIGDKFAAAESTYVGLEPTMAQVTMRNKIDVNFFDKSLRYETIAMNPAQGLNGAVYHELTNSAHIIEDRPGLGLRGTANWRGDENRFYGNVSSYDGVYRGKIEGRFYGNGAATGGNSGAAGGSSAGSAAGVGNDANLPEEIGGVFGLRNSDNTVHYVGGFGAKKEL